MSVVGTTVTIGLCNRLAFVNSLKALKRENYKHEVGTLDYVGRVLWEESEGPGM